MRAIVGPNKGRLQGTAARVPLDAFMERVAAPEGVTYEADTVGGVSGPWCKPEDARPAEVVLHIHGGWFNWGSAQAFRHIVGHIAVGAGVQTLYPTTGSRQSIPFPLRKKIFGRATSVWSNAVFRKSL
jgi:acetyl esterase/lipase